jgi:hypothetical protein
MTTVRRFGPTAWHALMYRSLDAVGNVGAVHGCPVLIDATAPTFDLSTSHLVVRASKVAAAACCPFRSVAATPSARAACSHS